MAKLIALRLTENELRALCFATFGYRIQGNDADTAIDVLRAVKARVVDFQADPWEFEKTNAQEGGPFAFVENLTKHEIRHMILLIKVAGRLPERDKVGMGGWPVTYCIAEDEDEDPGTWQTLRDKLKAALKMGPKAAAKIPPSDDEPDDDDDAGESDPA